MSRLARDDRGIAALEMGIFASLMLVVVFGALPLYAMTKSYQSVSKTSAATLRYATAVSANGTRTAGGTLSRRPSYDDIQRFARDTANDPALVVEVRVCKGATCTDITDASPTKASPIPASAGDTVRLTVRATVDMSLIGRVANATARLTGDELVFPDNDVTISATAAGREE